MRAHVVQHFANGPVLADGDVVGRHQPADRLLGVAEQRQRDGTLRGRQQRQQLAGGFRGQLLEKQRALVRSHVVQQHRHVFLRHRLQQGFLRLLGEVLEHRRGIFPGHHPEHDHLVFEAERGQQRCHLAVVTVAEHVPQACVIAGAKHRRELFGWTRLFPNRRNRPVALWTCELFFHLLQRCSDDIVMMHVWTDGLDGVEPQPVNQVEVARCKGRRMGTEVIGVGPATPVIDDQSNIERFGLVGALPGIAQQAGLIHA